MMDLGRLPGWSGSAGYGINNAGQVTGTSFVGALFALGHAFLYSNGQMMDLGTLGGSYSSGSGINNAGQVTGASDIASGSSHAFLYSNGQMLDLNDLIDPTLGVTLLNAAVSTTTTRSSRIARHVPTCSPQFLNQALWPCSVPEPLLG